jgi:branched-chain amino acid transport system substrate-binding protein
MATAAPAEGAAMAEWAVEQGYENGASLLDDTIEFTKQSDYGFRTRFEELGGNLVAEETFKQGDASIASQINALKSADPDFVYLASYMPDQASAMKQMRAAGLDMPILADEDVDGDYWKEAVPGISDVWYATYGSIYGDDPDETINELVDRYEEETGKLPDNATFLTGYAMVQAIAQAVEGADGSTEGTALQEQLQTFDDEDLLLPTTFTEEDHITLNRTLRIMEIQDEKSSFVEEWTPENVPVPPAGG